MPIISLSDAAGTEFSGPVFTVSLDEPSIGPIQVSYRAISGTAIEGSDFRVTEGDLVIPAGETSGTIAISMFSGTTEIDENFTLELFDPVNATLNGGGPVLRSTGVISEGSNVSLFVSDPLLVEGDDGTTNAVFEVRLSRAYSGTLSLDYTTADGSAKAGSDYTAKSGSLSFSPGQTTKTVTVPVLGDNVVEGGEYFSLIVTPDISAALVIANDGQDSTGIADILDDDTSTVLPVLSLLPTVGTESAGPQFVVYLDKPSVGATQFSYRTLSGTAIEGWDFRVTEGTAIIPAGETSITVGVSPFSGTTETDENLTLEVFDPVGAVLAGGGPSLRATGVMLEGSSVDLFVSDPVLIEGDSGTSEAQFEVRLSRPHTTDLTFTYQTVDGSAKAGSDYTAASGTLIFKAGQEVATISVDVAGDTAIEASEFFSLLVTPDLSAALVVSNSHQDAAGIAEIRDDDATPVLPVISVSPTTGNEAAAPQFIVSLDAPSAGQVQVSYRAVSGTALEGSDFRVTEGNLIIPAGKTSATINVSMFSGRTEIDENFTLEVFDVIGGELAGGVDRVAVTGVILEGNSVSLFVSEPDLIEGDGGTQLAVFEIQLSRASATDMTFSYKTIDGTAQAGSDYGATSGTLTIPAGLTKTSIEVPVFGDTLVEAAETFSLLVTPDIFAASLIDNDPADLSGIAEIFDDDAGTSASVPTISASATTGAEFASPQFVVTLDDASTGPVEVSYRTLSFGTGTALEGSDFRITENTLVIPAGKTTATIDISMFSGSTEIDENFTIELFDPLNARLEGGVSVLRVNGKILEGSVVSLFVSDPVLLEGDSGQTDAVFEIELSRPANTDLTIDYTTVDGTARAGSDYIATSGSLVIERGQTLATVRVPVNGDISFEESEYFSLVLTPDIAAAGAIANGAADSTGIATLLDDEAGISQPTINILPATGAEFAGPQFVLQMDKPTVGPVQVSYRTVSGTAIEGSDFRAATGDIIIPAGETTATLTIAPFSGTNEIDENFTVEFYNPINAQLEGRSQTVLVNGTIIEGSAISLFVRPTLAYENDGQAVFEVLLSRPSENDLSLNYTTSDGSAVAGSDYVAKSGTVTFLAGQTRATVFVDLIGSGGAEGQERFSLTVTPTIAIGNGTAGASNSATIIDGNRPEPTPEFFDVLALGQIGNSRGTFTSFANAQANAVSGDTIDVLASATVGNIGAQSVLKNNLTVDADAGFVADFTLANAVDRFSLTGSAAVDVTGASNADVITGNLGANKIDGNGGNDTLRGLGGSDTLQGGDDDDRLEGGQGSDSLDGGNDNDQLFGGGSGADTLEGGRGSDFLFGENGDDLLVGGDGFDLINGGTDDDTLKGGNGNDRLLGNLGNDSLEGDGGNDLLFGGPSGNDILKGGAGNDQLFGESGKDILFGDAGDDMLNGGGNDDTLAGGEGDDSLEGGAGNDQLFGGPTGADTLKGGQGSDFLFAESADDLLEGGDGFDLMNGGAGNDLMRGGNGNDRVEGNLGADTLEGGAGDDSLFGGNGAFADTLIGGAGNDRLAGEAGADVFIFADGFGQDVISDFDEFSAAEKIDLSLVTTITDFSDLANNHLSQSGADAVITAGANTITLNNVLITDLDAGDFDFIA
ncbi:MAG: hypothetical protein OIF48_11965 [Silicimonas sp.]|nr:hypothetical protein [Silicimonas sp.]